MVLDKYLNFLVEKGGNWIAAATKNKGGLHRALGVPTDKKIPSKDLTVEPGDSVKLKRQKVLAKNLKKIAAKRKK